MIFDSTKGIAKVNSESFGDREAKLLDGSDGWSRSRVGVTEEAAGWVGFPVVIGELEEAFRRRE